MARILVIYGTTEGHTEQIATAIGNTLTAGGFEVHTIQAGTLDPRPADYDGIIVSASVHGGRYQKAVGRWIRAHVDELRQKPSAFVSACLGVLQHDPKVDADLDAIIHRFVDPLGWQPTVIKRVAGALLYTKYNLLMRWMMKRIAAKAGGGTDTSRDYDYTDWDDLQVFAEDFGRRVVSNISLVPRIGRRSVLPRMVTTVLIALTATVASAQVPEPLRSVIAFDKATQDYVLMHRRLERQVGPIELGTSVDEINRRIQQLATAIRTERPAARQGDVITPSLSRLMRARIQEALTEHGYSVDDARGLARVDGVDYTRVKLQVNDAFPWVLGAAMLPCLINALPALPPELQYRMVDDLLVLVDVHASLIVDILPVRAGGVIFPASSKSPRLPAPSKPPGAETHRNRVARWLPWSGSEPFCKGP